MLSESLASDNFPVIPFTSILNSFDNIKDLTSFESRKLSNSERADSILIDSSGEICSFMVLCLSIWLICCGEFLIDILDTYLVEIVFHYGR